MMGICVVCGSSFIGRKGKKTCSDRCRQVLSRGRKDAWKILKEKLLSMGKDAAVSRLDSDDNFYSYVMDVLAGYIDAHPGTRNYFLELIPKIYDRPGVRRQDHLTDDQEALLDEMREGGGFTISIRQIPLASLAAIKQAGETSDWTEIAEQATRMLKDNKKIIDWPDGNGYGSWQEGTGTARWLINDDPEPWV